MRHRDLLRELDPLERHARPAADDDALLASILAAPYEDRPVRRGGRRALALVPVVLVAALALAVGVLVPGSDERPAAGATGPTIVHYAIQETWSDPKSNGGEPQEIGTTEVWQSSDGTRQRSVSDFTGQRSENVLDGEQSLTWIAEQDEIIRYRATDDYSYGKVQLDRPDFSPGPLGALGAPKEVGDPRELRDRAAGGDPLVRDLGNAESGGVAVRRFEVGDCTRPTRTRQDGDTIVTDGPQRTVVSLARGTNVPVRMVIAPCDPAAVAMPPTRTLDYRSFEVLPATADNRVFLELAPHQDARMIDGIEVDRAEERDER
jgi:hypothetical protein